MKPTKHPSKNVLSLERERNKREQPPPRVIPFLEKKADVLKFDKEVKRLERKRRAGKTSTALPGGMILDLDQFVNDVSEQMQTLFRNQKHFDRSLRNAHNEIRFLTSALTESNYSMCDLMIRVMNLENENESLSENLTELLRKYRRLRTRYLKAQKKLRAKGSEW